MLARAQRPGVGLRESLTGWLGCLEGGQLGPRVRIERGAQDARELTRAERSEHRDLGRLEPVGDSLGLLEESSRARLVPTVGGTPRIDLDRDQDLVLVGGAGG